VTFHSKQINLESTKISMATSSARRTDECRVMAMGSPNSSDVPKEFTTMSREGDERLKTGSSWVGEDIKAERSVSW
jgi:hypothetical protein